MDFDLSKYVGSSDMDIADVATYLTHLKADLDVGRITAAEFHDLARTALDAEKIDRLADDEDHRILLQKAFDAMTTIVSYVPL